MEQRRRQQLEGDASGVRYLDDVVRGVQDRAEALRVHKRLEERLQACRLELAPDKTRVLEWGRLAPRDAAKHGKSRPETLSCLGFTPDGTRHRHGHFTVERRTARQRLQRAAQTLQRRIRARLQAPGPDQPHGLHQYLRGHSNDYGIAGHLQSLLRLSRLTEKRWRKT